MALSKLDRIGLKITSVAYSFARGVTPIKRHPGIIVHHMGNGRFSEDTRHPGHVVHAMHLAAGYSGIGYHGVVTQAGKYYTGRPYGHRGAHCADAQAGIDRNDQFGILWFGGAGDPSKGIKPDYPTPEAVETLARVIAWVCLDQDIPCDRAHVKGHKEHLNTACPGNMYPQLDKAVARARQILLEVEKEPASPKLDTLRVIIETPNGAHDVPGLLLSGRSYVPVAELGRLGLDFEFQPASPSQGRKEASLFLRQKGKAT